MTAEEIIRLLGLEPHPEGGHYVQIHSDAREVSGRPVCTSIYFLLRAGEVSHWHRVDATEIWCHHAGAAVQLEIWEEGKPRRLRLGPDLAGGERPQGVVPAGAWQSARSLGEWSLVGCVVAPGFQFSGFELAPPGWTPPV
ncbi:cupin domain-containing protein [Deinococcus apachensis]|uniref:cupin domain-containing protein n=1 Tax=Deinococcus apachensis TaxID=309886 RepID=UPI000476D1A8|nr:cupin domain-containing protein [Deinococcus apachensis]